MPRYERGAAYESRHKAAPTVWINDGLAPEDRCRALASCFPTHVGRPVQCNICFSLAQAVLH